MNCNRPVLLIDSVIGLAYNDSYDFYTRHLSMQWDIVHGYRWHSPGPRLFGLALLGMPSLYFATRTARLVRDLGFLHRRKLLVS